MIVAIDIGNTTVGVYGVDENLQVVYSFKIPTRADWDVKQYRLRMDEQMQDWVHRESVFDFVISSVVPAVTGLIQQVILELYGRPAVVLTHTDNHFLQLCVKEPEQLGFDRIVDAVWAAAHYPLPVVTVDMGTATTFNVVDEKYRFLGGIIAPGILTGLQALSRKAAQLPEIPLSVPEHVIGKDTVSCMQSGAVMGAAAMVDGLVARVEQELGKNVTVVMTGGGAAYVEALCEHVHVYEPELLVKGLVYLYLHRNINRN